MVLLTGGTGFLGAHVARALLAAGRRVRCLIRPASRRENLEALPVELAEGDLLSVDSLRSAVCGCATVYHCAADYRLWARDPSELYRTNVDGTRNLFAAAAECGVERVVYTSSVGALGLRSDGEAADEETPVTLESMVGHYKRSKYLAEREAERWAADGLPVVIVNPSTPIGELDIKPTPTGQVIVDFLNGRIPAYVDGGLNVVDVRDVAAGHLLAEERGTPGEKYILGHRNVTFKQWFELLARLAGLRPPSLRLPHWSALAAAGVQAGWARVCGRPPRIPLEGVRMAKRCMFFDSSRAVRELGMPQTPVEEALDRALRWFRGHGYVRS